MTGRHYGPVVPGTTEAMSPWPPVPPAGAVPYVRAAVPVRAPGAFSPAEPADHGWRGIGTREPLPQPEEYRWRRYQLLRPELCYSMDRSRSAEGWPLLADDLWRVVHRDGSGARWADAHAVGLGLGAALLLELLVAGQVKLDEGRVLINDTLARTLRVLLEASVIAGHESLRPASVVPDHLAGTLLMLVFGEPRPLPVETWFAALAPNAAEKVAQRLLRDGHVEEHRGLLRKVTYRPVDTSIAAWPAARLLGPLQGRELDRLDEVLLGLCRALRLDRWLFAGQPADQVAGVLRLADELPEPFPEIWKRLDAVVTASAARLR